MKVPLRSALVDLVMKDATEEERAAATQRWFGFLQALLRIVEEEERRKADSRESGGNDRFAA